MIFLQPVRTAVSVMFSTGERAVMTRRGRILYLAIAVIGGAAIVVEGFGLFALMAILFRGNAKPVTLGMLMGVPAQSGALALVVPVQLVFVLIFGRMLVGPLLDYLLQRLAQTAAYRLRATIIRKATSLPALNAGSIPSGELATIANDEVMRCTRALTSFNESMQLASGVLFSGIFLVARDPGLNLAAVGAAMPLLIAYGLIANRNTIAMRELVNARVKAGTNVTEGLRSLAGIQAAGGGAALQKSLEGGVVKMLRLELQAHRNHIFLRYITGFAPIFAAAGALAYAWFVRDATTAGALAANLMPTAAVGGRLATASTTVVGVLYQMSVNVNSFFPVRQLLDRLDTLARPRNRQIIRRPADAGAVAAVKIDGCSFQLPNGTWLFRDLKIVLRPGHPVLLRGPSGSGKSTLASVIGGTNDPTEGQVSYVLSDGQEIGPYEGFLNFLSQDPAAMVGTMRSNLLLGADRPISDDALIDALKKVHLWEEVEAKGGLEAPVFEGGRNLSGGQIRRLGLARLLTREKSIWIFDEATASLDPHSTAIIEDLLRRIAEKQIVVVITHDEEFRLSGTEIHFGGDAKTTILAGADTERTADQLAKT